VCRTCRRLWVTAADAERQFAESISRRLKHTTSPDRVDWLELTLLTGDQQLHEVDSTSTQLHRLNADLPRSHPNALSSHFARDLIYMMQRHNRAKRDTQSQSRFLWLVKIINVSQRLYRNTEPRPQVTCTCKTLVKFGCIRFPRFACGQTDRQTRPSTLYGTH